MAINYRHLRRILERKKGKDFTCALTYVKIFLKGNRVAGWADLSFFYRMGVMPMKNHFDFKDLMTFGLFLLALLTFVFTFCK